VDQYSQYIATSRYCRWLPDEGRRETWEEAVSRYIDFMEGQAGVESRDLDNALASCKQAMLSLDVMPSMRALMTAGPALERDNIAGFNCGYTVIDRPKAFANLMYILMCGTGVGFSVERQYINKLPEVASEFRTGDEPIVVGDSKGGWAAAFDQLVQNLYDGIIPEWNLERVRAAGMPLKTFGGRASGPEPLEELFRYTAALFTQARGRKLNSIECHDLACKIAEIVVVGGVRRSALISLSNLSDDRMRRAKSGQWFDTHVERALANNSVAYTEKPDIEAFMQEWLAIVQSKSGERGIFNRVAANKRAVATGRRDGDYDFGCNPLIVEA